MATIKSTLAMTDGMTGTIRKINAAMNALVNTFENVQDISANVIDTVSLIQARELVAESTAEWDRMADSMRDAEQAQDQFNNSIRNGASAAVALGNKLKGIMATVVSIAGVKSALNWGKENFALADTQRNAENQLRLVLANMGAQDIEIPVNTTAGDAADALQGCAEAVNALDGKQVEIGVSAPFDAGGLEGNTFENTLFLDTNEAAAAYEELTGVVDGNTLGNAFALDAAGAIITYDEFVSRASGGQIILDVQADTTQTMSAFDAIAAKASEIQGRGVYGDEIMLAGAAELATYFSDTEAIMSMMDTLSNYAMGMSATEGRGLDLDSAAMVQYATNLGKVMTGTYTAMSQKGFKFTDAQKAIIEGTATQAQVVEALGAEYLDMSADMQAAAAINSVIAEAWDGLYDNMSNTPEGRILQFNHTLGDVRENLGDRLYPAALHFVDVFTQRLPQIEGVLTWFTDGLSTLIAALTWIAALGLDVATVFADNWSWIGPIVMGVAGAYIVLHGAILAYNAVQAISNGIQAISAAHTAWKTAATLADVAATQTATGAQAGLNAAMLACPTTWIVGGIIAIIAALYAAVAAVNKFSDKSYSATGLIAGFFYVLGAHIINGFVVPFQNGVAAAANFLGNVFCVQ